MKADTLSQLFADAAFGMFRVISGDSLTFIPATAQEKKIYIELSDTDYDNLLFKWLNELLYKFEVNNFFLTNLEIQGLEKFSLYALCKGADYNVLSITPVEIKAVTFHNLEIKKINGGFCVNIVFDV